MFGCIVPTRNRDREEDLYQDLLSLWDLYGNSIARDLLSHSLSVRLILFGRLILVQSLSERVETEDD
jgi:hypothetical protein